MLHIHHIVAGWLLILVTSACASSDHTLSLTTSITAYTRYKQTHHKILPMLNPLSTRCEKNGINLATHRKLNHILVLLLHTKLHSTSFMREWQSLGRKWSLLCMCTHTFPKGISCTCRFACQVCVLAYQSQYCSLWPVLPPGLLDFLLCFFSMQLRNLHSMPLLPVY